ncbi:hypothetical protein JVU11DRAFT_3802 [Chiua virens]|nr:hypothetical protein JVU11DRAFT_3802 [Chiua virens]
MNTHIATTSTSALPSHPERPFKYVEPATALGGTVVYDRPPETYFDVPMASRLLPAKPPTMLYDTIARAHDHQFQVSPNMVDPSWTTPRPLILNPTERRRSLAKVTENSPECMGISPDVPEWRPRRSPYEDRRGAVGVAPSEVNTLVPYIPPIDTSMPPPSKEWLDAKAKQILAEAHAEFTRSRTKPAELEPSRADDEDEDDFFEYDIESTLDERASVPCAPPLRPHQAEPESYPYDNDPWNVDTDTDMDSDDGYNCSMTHISISSHRALSDVPQWKIQRRRPSVVNVDKDVTTNAKARSSSDERAGKRPNDAKSEHCRNIAKIPKRHESDLPVRQGSGSSGHESEEDTSSGPTSFFPRGTTPSRPPMSSVTAAALQMKQVRITSPTHALPPVPKISVPPKPAKVFPCHLNNCIHVCASAGDLQRHQQSLRHRPPSHTCLACGKSYTRSDALKRHLNSKAACKKVHATKLANGAEGPADTNTKAV